MHVPIDFESIFLIVLIFAQIYIVAEARRKRAKWLASPERLEALPSNSEARPTPPLLSSDGEIIRAAKRKRLHLRAFLTVSLLLGLTWWIQNSSTSLFLVTLKVVLFLLFAVLSSETYFDFPKSRPISFHRSYRWRSPWLILLVISGVVAEWLHRKKPDRPYWWLGCFLAAYSFISHFVLLRKYSAERKSITSRGE